MPTQDWGVYQDSLTLGTEVSSTYEGRHITATAAELNHGNVLAVVTKGYPVIFGIVAGAHGVGVAFQTEVAGTDLIAVDTEGVWNLSVVSSDDAGNSLVVAGDPLFINTTTAVISKIRDNATQIPFGYALCQGNGDGLAHTLAVKVHWDPRSHWLEDQEMLYFGNLRDVSIEWDGNNLEMLPLVDDTGAFNIGNGTLSMDVQIFGLTANDYVLWDNSQSMLSVVNTAVPPGDAYSALRVLATSTLANNAYGLAAYFDTTLNGVAAGGVYGVGSWINTAADFTSTGDEIIVPFEGGIYAAAVNATGRFVFAGQHQAILSGVPGSLHAWRLNVAAAGGAITALIAAANWQSVNYQNGTAGTGVVGTIPLADVVGFGVRYVDVHAAVA